MKNDVSRKLKLAMVAFSILKNRTKAFKILNVFSANELYRNKQISFYNKVSATFNAFWLCEMKLPGLLIGSSLHSYINYVNSKFG